MNDHDLTTVRQIVKQVSNHACAVVRGSDQSTSDQTLTVINFLDDGAIDVDTDGMFDTASPAQLTIRHQGLYLLGAHLIWESNATGRRDLYIRVNDGSIVASRMDAATGLGTAQTVTTMTPLKVDDVVTMLVYQNSGGALNAVAGYGGPKLWVVRLT